MIKPILAVFVLISVASAELVHYHDYNHDIKEIKKVYKFEDDDSVFRVKGKDFLWTPVQSGKVLAYMAQEEWADRKVGGEDGHLTFHYQQPWDSQFIIFNIGFPFPAPFGRGYLNIPPPESGVFPTATVIYGKGANPYSVFQQATTEFADSTGSVYRIFPAFLVNLVFPAEAQGLHALRILQARLSVQDMDLDADKQSALEDNILGFFDIFLNSVYNVVYDEDIKLKYDDILPTLSDPTFSPLTLANDDILYASSDESFHFWLGDDGTKAYVVDAGSLYLAQGLSGIIANHASVTAIYITITHFHIEHIQALAGLIVNSPGVEIKLVLAQSLSLEFSGWYLEHYERLAPLIESGQLQIQIVDEDVWVQFGEYDLMLLLTRLFADIRLKHFIPNASPIIRDNQGRFRLFGGDLQSNQFDEFGIPIILPNQEALEALEIWMENVFQTAGVSPESPIDFYFYIGLFFFNVEFYYFQAGNPNLATPEDFVAQMKATVPGYINLDIVQCHIKDENGFNMERRSSFSLS